MPPGTNTCLNSRPLARVTASAVTRSRIQAHSTPADTHHMELPRVRRWRKDGFDRLYVEDQHGETLGWADTVTGDTIEQVPGSLPQIEAALERWAAMYPDDDLATHPPGRQTQGMAAAWQAEIRQIDRDIEYLRAMRDAAVFQRDQYLKGTSGEHHVGRELNRLYKSGWGILHAIPIYDARADIDHLLIGRAGVWTVNSKAIPATEVVVRRDSLRIGRISADYIAAAEREAQLVTQVLGDHGFSVPVQALIVFDTPPETTIRFADAPPTVGILRVEQVVRYLDTRPTVIDALEVNRIYAVARRPETWGSQ